MAILVKNWMGIRLRVVLIVLVSALALLSAAGWYVLHNPDRYIPRIDAYLQQKTGLQVEIRHVEVLTYPTLIIRVYGLQIKNPKPFPAGDFLNVPRVDAVVENLPLLYREIVIRSLVLYQPVINFVSDPDGLWNFQNPSGPRQQPTRFSMGVISSLQIKNGLLQGSNLVEPNDRPGPVVMEFGNFSAQLNQIHFHPLADSGPPRPIEGSLQADTVRFGSIHTKNLHSQLQITLRQLAFKNFRVTTYRGHASGNFSLLFEGKNPSFDTALRVSGIGMPYLLAEFRQGPPAMTGMMEADLHLGGAIEHTANPLAGMHGTGRVIIRQGELPGLSQNKNMAQMKRFRDPGTASLPVSAFSTFSGDMDLRDHRIYSKQIGVNFYGIDIDGSGSTSVMSSGGINYQGVATVLTKQGFFTNVFAKAFKGAHEQRGRLKFPIRITGTLANPQCSVVH